VQGLVPTQDFGYLARVSLNVTPGKQAISLDNLLMAGRRKDNTHTHPVQILQPEKTRLSTTKRRQAESPQRLQV
jgi:hypothetical protein